MESLMDRSASPRSKLTFLAPAPTFKPSVSRPSGATTLSVNPVDFPLHRWGAPAGKEVSHLVAMAPGFATKPVASFFFYLLTHDLISAFWKRKQWCRKRGIREIIPISVVGGLVSQPRTCLGEPWTNERHRPFLPSGRGGLPLWRRNLWQKKRPELVGAFQLGQQGLNWRTRHRDRSNLLFLMPQHLESARTSVRDRWVSFEVAQMSRSPFLGLGCLRLTNVRWTL